MATTIPDLWSDDIKVDVLPPVAVLKAQEGLLSRKTQGMLEAKLTTTETDKLVQHQLDLIAPSLNFYRERLLTARHDREMLYPVIVTAQALAPKNAGIMEAFSALASGSALSGSGLASNQREAPTDDAFIRIVQDVLRSDHVRSLIHSLIARINARAEQPTNGSANRDEGKTS